MRTSSTTLLIAVTLLLAAACWDLGLEPPPHDAVDGGPDGDGDTDGDGDCDPGWAGASCEICVRFVAFGQPEGGDGLTWLTPFNNVPAAVEAAASAEAGPSAVCEVWVSTSTYWIYQSSSADTISLPHSVHLYGGFAGTERLREERDFVNNVTELSGRDETGSFSVYHVIRAEGSAETGAVIDGFTISGGIANGEGVEGQGGGLLNYQHGMLVDNCVFQSNEATEGGGAIANIHADMSIRRTRFVENTTSASGGAIFTQSGEAHVENCVFWNNGATAGGGAIYCVGDTDNQAGGVWINSTFHDNSPDAIYNQDNCHPNTRNDIFWETGDPPIDNIGSAGAEVEYCRIDGDFGPLNVDGDPNFADAEGGDFHLDPGSACVDKADGTGAPESDIEGVPRYDWPDADGGVGDPPYVDIGAYELSD